MRLLDYLIENKLKQAEFAQAVGESVQNINRYAKGKRRPSDSDVMRRIFDATNGQVTANDFYDLPNPPGKNKKPRRPKAS